MKSVQLLLITNVFLEQSYKPLFSPVIVGVPSVVTQISFDKSRFVSVVDFLTLSKTFASVAVSFIGTDRTNSFTISNIGVSSLKNSASCAVSLISVLSSMAMQYYSKFCKIFSKPHFTFAGNSSIRRVTVLADWLIPENKSFFSGQTTSTSFGVHSLMNFHKEVSFF